MKKSIYIILLLTIFIFGMIEVNASSGRLRKDSIKTCNGTTYGQHSSDNHWHVAEEKDGSYYATGNPIYSDPCSSNNSSSNNSSSSNNNSSNSSSNNNSNGSNNQNNNSSSNQSSNGNSSSNNNVQNETPKSSDNTLKKILINDKEVVISDNMEYSTVNNKVKIDITTNDSKATYEIKNNNELVIGENVILIDVKAENGNIKTYNIKVTRTVVLSSDTGFELKIDDEIVEFINNKATVYVSSSANNIKIEYKLNHKNAQINMDKLDNLETGDNNLNIEIIAEDGTKEVFKLTIHKYSKTEDIISSIVAIGLLGGIGYGIYYACKKSKNIVNKLKNAVKNIKK